LWVYVLVTYIVVEFVCVISACFFFHSLQGMWCKVSEDVLECFKKVDSGLSFADSDND